MRKKCSVNLIWVAFGAGCAVALCLPTVWITRILALTVVVLGLLCCKKPDKHPEC